MKRIPPAIIAVSASVAAAVTWAGALAPAWPAAQGRATGVRPPGAQAAGTALPAGSWGQAIEVPGLGALNTGGDAQVTTVSCTSAGNCAAGGYYLGSRNGQYNPAQGFVAGERDGSWGQAIEVPGLGTLNTDGYAQVNSVSCASAGNCAAGGFYENRSIQHEGFVADERDGSWGQAIEVPGLGALNKGAFAGSGAEVTSVSCASPGNCAAGGDYTARHGRQQGFVAIERNGRWATAIEVPGLRILNKGGEAEVSSVSCGAPGSCAAGGFYTGSQGLSQGFVAAELHGRWRTTRREPGPRALNKADASDVNSVSCASAGNCAAGGTYLASSGGWQGFVAGERHGRWGTAIQVPGLAALNTGGLAEVSSVSCASPGNCAAGGFYSGSRNRPSQGFVAGERNGRWRTAIQVPGLAAPTGRQVAAVTSVSCAPAGDCAAGGYLLDRSGHFHVFVASERNGRWGTAIQVPGLAALNKGSSEQYARVNYFPTVSCAPAGMCAAGGSYIDASGHAQGFVTQAS